MAGDRRRQQALPWWRYALAPCGHYFRVALFLLLAVLASAEVSFERLFGNSGVVDEGDIFDAGFAATKAWHAYLAQRQDLIDYFSMVSTFLCTTYSAMGLFWFTLAWRRYGLALCMFLVLLFRSLLGACTSLPRSREYLYSIYDIPNAMTDNFIFLYSGHAANLSLFGHWCWLSGMRRFATFVHFTQLLQWLFLISTRGHYTVDLILGALFGAYAATWEPVLTAAVARIELAAVRSAQLVSAQTTQKPA